MRKQKKYMSLILLFLPLMAPSRRSSIDRPGLAVAPLKISNLITLVKEKRRQMKDIGDDQDGDRSYRKKTITGVAGTRGCLKRTADRVGLNEGGECIHILE